MHFMLNNNDIMSTNLQEYDASSCSLTSSPSPSNKASKKYKKKNKKHHQCNICGKIVRSPGLLRLHIDEDHNFVRIKCEICDKRVKKKNFRKHLRIHNRSPKMSYTCKKCNKIFYTTKSLNNHKAICSILRTENLIVCNICNEEFQSDDLFESHLDNCPNDQAITATTSASSYTILKNLLHSTGDEPNYYCDICQKEFDSEDFLLKHKSIHDNCTCLVCGKVLASKAILKRHMSLHNESECVTCNVCGKQFTRDSNLKAHMKIHLNIRSHACEECGKLFRRKYHLKRHMLTHTGEKPYACQLCDKKYTSKESLRCHERSLHNVFC